MKKITKSQQTKSQPPKPQPRASKPQTPFEQQLESERKRLRQAGESGGQTNWIRLIAELGHEVLLANARQLRLSSQFVEAAGHRPRATSGTPCIRPFVS